MLSEINDLSTSTPPGSPGGGVFFAGFFHTWQSGGLGQTQGTQFFFFKLFLDFSKFKKKTYEARPGSLDQDFTQISMKNPQSQNEPFGIVQQRNILESVFSEK